MPHWMTKIDRSTGFFISKYGQPYRWLCLRLALNLTIALFVLTAVDMIYPREFMIWPMYWMEFIIGFSLTYFDYLRCRDRLGPMNRRPTRVATTQGFTIVGLFAVWSLGYFAVQSVVNPATAHTLPMPFDNRIPFIEYFTLPYVALYPMFFVPLLLIREPKAFDRLVTAYVACFVTCWFVFLTYPVHIERPSFEVTNFSFWVMSVIYSADNAVNCFPSIHASMTLLAGLILWHYHRVYGAIGIALAALISVSTLFIKQHYVMDIVFSTVLGYAVYHAFYVYEIDNRMAGWWETAKERGNDWIGRLTSD
ncbi:phosphatase PAP2 family protein [bacterium]|nr:phosphatase PAP2 family protein [bacterium]